MGGLGILAVLVLLGALIGALGGGGGETADKPISRTEEQTQKETDKTEEQAQQELEQTRQELAQVQQELEQAEEEADEAREQAEQAQEEVARANREAEEARKEAEQAAEEAQATPSEENASPEPASPDESGSGTAIVRITGTNGIPFSGSYGNIDTSRTVDGTVPAVYEQKVDTGFLSFDSVSATFQKMGAGGTLTVQIVHNGKVVKQASTTAQYGVVSVVWSPAE